MLKKSGRNGKESKKTSVVLPPGVLATSTSDAPPAMVIAIGGQKFALTHSGMVNNPEYADFCIVLVVGGKKETLWAHEGVLSFRSATGLTSQPSPLVARLEKKGGVSVATVAESALGFCSSNILLALLRYLYTSDVRAVESSEDLPFLVNLLATTVAAGLGDSYLARVIEERVGALTTLATAHLLIARTYEYKLDRLHYATRAFAFRNWGPFVSDKDGCRRLGVELLSKLSAANAKGETEVVPTFPAPATHDKILADLATMQSSANAQHGTSDVLLECTKGAFVPAHHAVLACFCEGFRAELGTAQMQSPKKKGGPSRAEVLFSSNGGADRLNQAAATALLRFVYFGDIGFSGQVAVDLILALADYKIASLEAACELAIQNGVDVKTAFPILGVTFHPLWVTRPSMSVLRKTVTDFIVENFHDIDLNMWADLPPVLFHALQAVQRSQKSGGLGASASSVAALPPRPVLSSPSPPSAVLLQQEKPQPRAPSQVLSPTAKVESLTPPPPSPATSLPEEPKTESSSSVIENSAPIPPALPSKPVKFVAEDDEEEEENTSDDSSTSG